LTETIGSERIGQRVVKNGESKEKDEKPGSEKGKD